MDIRNYFTKQSEIQKKGARDEKPKEKQPKENKKRRRDKAAVEPPKKRQKMSNSASSTRSNLDLLNAIRIDNILCYLDKGSADNLQQFRDNYLPLNNDDDMHSIYLINGNNVLDDKYCALGFGFKENNYSDPNYSKNYHLAQCYDYPSKLTLQKLQKEWGKQFNIPVEYQLIYCCNSPIYKYQRSKSKIRRCSREKTTKFFDIQSNQNGKIKNIFQTENEYLLLDKRRISTIPKSNISYDNLSQYTFLSLKYFNIKTQTLDFMAFLLVKDAVTFNEIRECILGLISKKNINRKFIDLQRYIMTFDDSSDKIRVHSEQYSYKLSVNGTIKDLKDSCDRYSDIIYEKHLFFDINPNHPQFQNIRNEFENQQKMYDGEYVDKFYFDGLHYIDDEHMKQVISIKHIHDTNQQNIDVIVTRSYDSAFWKKMMVKALGLDKDVVHHIEIYKKNDNSYAFRNKSLSERVYDETYFVSFSEFYWELVEYNTLKKYSINDKQMLYSVEVYFAGQFPNSTDVSQGIPCIHSFEYFKQFKVSDLVIYLLCLFQKKYSNRFKQIFDQIDEWKKKKTKYYPFITTGKLHWSHKQYTDRFDINFANTYSPFGSVYSERENKIDFNQPYRLLLFFVPKNKNLDDTDLYAKDPDEEEESDDWYPYY